MRKIIWKSWVIIFGLLICQLVSSQIKVACIGNSITYGYGLSSPSTQSYPAKLQALLGKSYEVSNFGVSARTMLNKGDRPYWNESQYNQALNLKPDIVIIMLGTNDAKLNTNWTPYKSEFKNDYKAMIKSFRDLSSNPEIWVCLIVPAYQTIWEISDATIKNEVNPKIKEVAVEEGLSLLDMYTAMENKSSMFQSDGIHPNAAGAEEMANYIYSIILQDTQSIQREGDTLQAPEAAGYQWYFNEQLISESDGGLVKKLKADSVGLYKVGVQLADESQTTIMSEPFNFEISVSVDALHKGNNQLNLYPNPCNNMLTVQVDNAHNQLYEFNIYKYDGRLLYSQVITIGRDKTIINLQSFSNGIYIYQLKIKDNILESGKIVINHMD